MKDNDTIIAFENFKNSQIQAPIIHKLLFDDVLSLLNRQKAEIERLQKSNDLITEACGKIAIAYKTAKSESIKEFAKRLKAISHPYGDTQMVFELQIDNLVKEMVGDDNA